jgi:hypothetical protein
VSGQLNGLVGFVLEVGWYSVKVIPTKNKRTGREIRYNEYGKWIAKSDVLKMDMDPEAFTECVDITLDSNDAVWFYDLTDRKKGDSGWKANS